MLANSIWIYSWPYSWIVGKFGWTVLLTLLLEALIVLVAGIPWRRTAVTVVLANSVSFVAGLISVRILAAILKPSLEDSYVSITHLFAAYFYAYIITVLTEGLVYRAVIRKWTLAKLMMLAVIANAASYAAWIGINWKDNQSDLKTSRVFPTGPLHNAEKTEPTGSPHLTAIQ